MFQRPWLYICLCFIYKYVYIVYILCMYVFSFVCVCACSNYKLKHSSLCASSSSLKLIDLKQKNALNLPANINKKSSVCVGVCECEDKA